MGIFSRRKRKFPLISKSWQRKQDVGHFNIPKKSPKKPKKKFSRFLFWLLFVGFLGICLYLVFFSTYLEIDTIKVEGGNDISGAEISSLASKTIEGKYAGYLPKNNFFLSSRKGILDALRNNFENLEVLSLEKKFPETMVITVVERNPEMVWCSGGVCYFLDKEGYAYSGAAGTEEELMEQKFLVVVDDSAIPIDIGKTKIDKDFMTYVESSDAMIKEDLGLQSAGSYHTPGIASMEIHLKTNETWVLKLSSEYTVDETKHVIQALFDKELNGDQRKNLEYLDLRIKGKVYYKTR